MQPARPPMIAATPTRRRRRSRIVWACIVLAGVLAGRGLGWWGAGGASTSGNAAQQPPSAAETPAESPATGGHGDGAPPSATSPAATPAGDVDAEAALAGAGAPASPPPAAGLDADRFQALLSLVALRRERGESGGALTALRRMATLPLDAAQHDAVRRLAGTVAGELEQACDEVMALLQAGRVLTARDRIQALDAEDGAAAAAALAARLARSPEGLVAVPTPGDLPWPVAAPLARDRTVHARLPGGFAVGRVVAARADGLTLRVETQAGVTFPSVAMAAVEPSEPTAAEAVELALAALHAGDGLLARLWLACADLRGGASRRQELVRRLLA